MTQNRTRIAILFNFRKGWMGGIIYIINLVNSLNFLDDEDKPEIIIFYNPDLSEFVKEFNYPYIKFKEWNFPVFWKGYLLSWLTGKNAFVEKIIQQFKPVGIYPLNDWPVSGKRMLKNNTRVVAWVPDLQHKFYPHFFTKLRAFMREVRIKLLLKNANDLAVSSMDVGNHFTRFYRLKPSLKVHALQFVSLLPQTVYRTLSELKEKYAIPDNYFIVSNQFTNHKNHLVVLEAIRILRERNFSIFFVFTGKTDFSGNEQYIAQIRAFIQDHKLSDSIAILGIIPRHDQLSLMKYAQAVVQPSLFEGWSTVIEDAKSLAVPVIASDLAVNIEQLADNGVFFKRHDANSLVQILTDYNRKETHYMPYNDRVKSFAKSFIQIFKQS